VLKKCTLPFTGIGVVDVIITDKAVFNITSEGLVLKEKLGDMTVDELRAITDAEFTVAPDLCEYRV
jgi:acyl CoA:acetate/3-ketoacid CoA transferase beta subunit